MVNGTFGVYKIENLKNGRVYIGYSSNLYKRANKHFKMLSENSHRNRALQSDWNTYGSDNFRFLVEHVIDIDDKLTKDELLEIGMYFEDMYINKYDNKYNVLHGCNILINKEDVDIRDRICKTYKFFDEKGYYIKSPIENMTVIRTRRVEPKSKINKPEDSKIKNNKKFDTTAIGFTLKELNVNITLDEVILSLKSNNIIDSDLNIIKHNDVIVKHEYINNLIKSYGLRIYNSKFNEFHELIKCICDI